MHRLEIAGPRAFITLDRPPVNAIDATWLASFHEALDTVTQDANVVILHIRSALRLFCAGMDLAQIKAFFDDPDGATRFGDAVEDIQKLYDRIESLKLITIAEMGSSVLGGGMELALACDLRIATESAQFGLPECGIGLIPGAGGTQRLTRLLGAPAAAKIILGGGVLNASAAADIGLVTWVCPDGGLEAKSDEVATRICEMSHGALLEAKQLIAIARDHLGEGSRAERLADKRLFVTADTRARISKFFKM